MAPIEGELLQNLGNSYLQSVVTLFIALFFYGVFVVLFSASIVIFVRKGFSNRRAIAAAMFVAIAINFLLSSLVTGTQVAIFVLSIRQTLIFDIDYPLSEKLELVEKEVGNLNITIGWAGNIAMLLSDLIVIWRAWALFLYQRRLILLPLILWIGAVATAVTCCSLAPIGGPMSLTTSPLIISLSIASVAFSIATNAVTTLLIVYKLWSYLTFIVKTLGLRGRTSPAQTILIILVESGLVYLGIQIVFLVLILHDNFTSAFQAMCSLSVIYPTLVIVLVETQRSMSDICEISPSNASKIPGLMASDTRAATLGHLSFAAGTVHSTTDNELESQRPWIPDGQLEEHGFKVVLELKERV